MKLREALFFSSQHTAYKGNMERRTYLLRVKEDEEEYTPITLFNPVPGPHLRTVYRVLVYRQVGEPHRTCSFHDIDACEYFLKEWCIDVDNGWMPQEEEVEHYFDENGDLIVPDTIE